MHRDLLTALWNREDVRVVYDRLRDIIYQARDEEVADLWQDVITCDHIRCALKEPVGSIPYQWATAYMEEAQKQEESKSPRQLKYEKRRREIELEYLRCKEEETNRIKELCAEREREEREEEVRINAHEYE